MKVIYYFICGFILTYGLLSCGEAPLEEGLQEMSSPQQHPIQEDELEENTFYTQGDPIRLPQEVELKGQVTWICAPKTESFVCESHIQEVSPKTVSLSKKDITFHTAGMFLVKNKINPEKVYLMKIQPKTEDQLQFQDFKISQYKDSIYNMLYHFEISPILSQIITQTFLKNFPLQVQWHVTGGRYHFYDAELAYLKRARPFRKTILFLEKKFYDIQVTLALGSDQTLTQQSHLDLQAPKTPSKTIESEIQIEHFPDQTQKEFTLLGLVKHPNIRGPVTYQWKVKRIQPVYCSESITTMEDASGVENICNKSYEVELKSNLEFDMETTENKAQISFHEPGRYAVDLWIIDENHNPISKFTRKIDFLK
ncbi:MAG: hypothetical protein HY390_00210 [Deltaproteobacteria bacterium]|nr:hypothetical protein [Deltaproteobacteria bacterium]